MRYIRLFIKYIYKKVGLGPILIEYCKICGTTQPVVWYADDDLWEEIVGNKYEILCPNCFDKEAWKKGIVLKWKPNVIARRDGLVKE